MKVHVNRGASFDMLNADFKRAQEKYQSQPNAKISVEVVDEDQE